ncbi:MAG TPA: ATP-binding protein [Candidatus Saccharimonadales bacterium]|jgi:PAS domain S-box-containing protein|nr:ATP-binding protein [Candidatus Saccharimonadales bacterium]
MVVSSHDKAGNSLTIRSDGIISVVLHGVQTAERVRAISGAMDAACEARHARGEKALITVDMRALTLRDSTTSGRTEGKKMLTTVRRADAIAIVGKGQLIAVAMYLVRAAKPGLKIHFFRGMVPARAWLTGATRPRTVRPIIGLVTGVACIAIGLLALIGWQFSNHYLMSFIPSLRPMNPMAAVGVIVGGWAFISYWNGRTRYLRLAGAITLALGVAALLPLHVNYVLYGDRVTAAGEHTHIGISAAICFIGMGLVALVARRNGLWVRIAEYIAGGVMAALSLINIFGQLYAYHWIYAQGNFVMSLNLAIAFAIATTGLILLIVNRQKGDVLLNVTRIGWLVVFVLIFVQVATYGAWVQTVNRNMAESRQTFLTQSAALNASVRDRIQAYENALRGFRGLYTASTYVSQGDFLNYYNSLNLTHDYPGLRSMAFIAAVRTIDLPAFVKQHQQDTSLFQNGNPSFKIQSQTSQPMHYIATYTSDSTNTSGLGLDLTSIPGRTDIYSATIASGADYTSGTVQFLPSATQAAQQGFFITIPVRFEGTDTYVGVVNAIFAYNTFFPKVFSDTSLQTDLNVMVRDNAGAVIYRANQAQGAITTKRTFTIPIANGGWQMLIEAPHNFGISSGQARLPMAILSVGQLFAVILIWIFVSQTRARRQAMLLVDEATSDLQRERTTIKELNEKDEAILGGLGEGLIALDRKGRVERINTAGEQILGRTELEIVGKQFATAWQVADMNFKEIPASKRPITQAMTKNKVVNARLYYTRKNGERFPVDMNIAPIIVGGKLVGAIEVFRDITHEFELDKAKSEFVSLASHQLRTPLSAINWYAEMLLHGDAGTLTKDQKDYVREIYEGNQRMIELVNSLLDVSRLELGRMTNEPAPTSMIDLVSDIEKELMTSILSKKLNFEKELQAHLQPVVADPKQLRMVVQNLLSNAVKYTPDRGSVHVILRRATDKDILAAGLHGHNYVYFRVQDTGFGIPKNQQPHIFEKLFRADNVRKMDVEGTGLGLYIVKQVVEGIGGHVWFTSVESVGTTFYVVVPFKASRPKPAGGQKS